MNSFELNKILGAILGTCLILLALNIGAGAIFAPEKPAKPGYMIAVKTEGGGEKTAEKPKEVPLPVRLAKAVTPSKRAARTGSGPISGTWSGKCAGKAAVSTSPKR